MTNAASPSATPGDHLAGKMEKDIFLTERRQVLSGWPTGGDVSEEAFEYLARRGERGAFHERLHAAKLTGKTLLQPRVGVPGLEQEISLLQAMENEGTADLLSHTIDSYTRNNRYGDAQRYLDRSRNENQALLNGFPLVNHGVKNGRRVVESLSTPLQIRHGSPDGRLLAEIALASGYTAYEGGGITYNLPYTAKIPLAQTIRHWQYVDRLSGYYTERGVTVNRESFGALTGTLLPPGIVAAISVFEGLLAAEQGVKSYSPGYAQCGNVVQDVAAIKAIERLTCGYLERFGFGDVEVTTVLHQWMGPFPMNEARALGLIGLGALTAALAGATKVMTKTAHEAFGVPTKEANVQGLLCSRVIVNSLAGQNIVDPDAVEDETRWIIREASAIIDKALEVGGGVFSASVVRGFQAGIIDVPFSPSQHLKGKVMPIRDRNGAVRYLDTGDLPFDRDVVERNRDLVQQRMQKAPGVDPIDLVVRDIDAFVDEVTTESAR